MMSINRWSSLFLSQRSTMFPDPRPPREGNLFCSPAQTRAAQKNNQWGEDHNEFLPFGAAPAPGSVRPVSIDGGDFLPGGTCCWTSPQQPTQKRQKKTQQEGGGKKREMSPKHWSAGKNLAININAHGRSPENNSVGLARVRRVKGRNSVWISHPIGLGGRPGCPRETHKTKNKILPERELLSVNKKRPTQNKKHSE